ncbi:MAG: S24 family peptidase [Erysipelotrichaceae bacterium]|nr:S24 family peptidase [Erysipelotrichaceae bacterium]
MFRKNMRYLRRHNGLSQQDLADSFGYKSFTTIQKWEDGTSVPPYDILEKLAKRYGVAISDFMHKDLTKSKVKVPVLGVVRGGLPITAEQNVIDYEEIDSDEYAGDDYFYLEVIGDSMRDARILPGDRIYVHKQNYLDNNDIGVVMIDNEATVKYVIFKADKMILKPANPDYQPIEIDNEMLNSKQVKILGKVIHNKISY